MSHATVPPSAAPAAAAPARATAAEVLARTLHAEAGARPVRAIEALAALAANRARAGVGPWGADVAAVCRAPFGPFGCWTDPRAASHARLRGAAPADPALAVCRRIAARAVAGALPDPTGGATHWHADDAQPAWSLGLVPVAEVGGLLFYRPEVAGAVAVAAPPSRASRPALAAVRAAS